MGRSKVAKQPVGHVLERVKRTASGLPEPEPKAPKAPKARKARQPKRRACPFTLGSVCLAGQNCPVHANFNFMEPVTYKLPDSSSPCPICLCEVGDDGISLECGHATCVECLRQLVASVEWKGAAVKVSQIACPLGCGRPISLDKSAPGGPELHSRVQYLGRIAEKVRELAENMIPRVQKQEAQEAAAAAAAAAAQKEKEEGAAAGEGEEGEGQEAEAAAMDQDPEKEGEGEVDLFLARHVILQCAGCDGVLYGGKGECVAAGEGEGEGEGKEPEQLQAKCPKCLYGEQATCSKHGDEYTGYKCRFCCSPATFACSGASAGMPGPTHFCEACHPAAYDAKPKPCDLSTCPFQGNHAPNPLEMPLGCVLCRQEGN